MHASSGLEWNESYFLPGDFHNMFMHSDDKGGYAASKKAEFKPNEVFEYSSGTSNLLSRIIRDPAENEPMVDLLREQVGYQPFRIEYEEYFDQVRGLATALAEH